MRRGIALIAIACLMVACGASHKRGVDGAQWPPPASVLSGPPTTARFCALLVDDEEHVKAVQRSHGLAAAIAAYKPLFPGLQAAAPPQIASDVRIYLVNVSAVFAVLARHGYNYFDIPAAQLKTLNASGNPVVTNAVNDFATRQCDYNINGGT